METKSKNINRKIKSDRVLTRRELSEKMRKESLLTREESMRALKEFEESEFENLNQLLD